MKACFWIDSVENYQFSILGQKYWLQVNQQCFHYTLLFAKHYGLRSYHWVEIPRVYENPEKASFLAASHTQV